MSARLGLALCMLLVLAGCETPAQLYWSPDLSKAAYVPTGGGEGAIVIDAQGAVVAKLGSVVGGCAWSADSARLYVAQVLEQPPAKATTLEGVWVQSAPKEWLDAQLAAKAPDPNAKDPGSQVGMLENGQITPLFELPRDLVIYMLLSPDGKWLAAQTTRSHDSDAFCNVYVCHLESRKVWWLSAGAAIGMCFTGDHRLALLESVEIKNGVPSPIGELTEITLDENGGSPQRMARATALIGEGWCWMQAAGEDLLFASVAWSFPGPPVSDQPVEAGRKKLFRYVRGEGVVKVALEDVGAAFTLSPDGKKVLLEKWPAPFTEGNHKVALLELATGKVHELCDYQVRAKSPDGRTAQGTPAFPTWRGNDEVCLVRQEEADKFVRFEKEKDRAVFELGLYRINNQFQLELERILSKSWDGEGRPCVKLK